MHSDYVHFGFSAFFVFFLFGILFLLLLLCVSCAKQNQNWRRRRQQKNNNNSTNNFLLKSVAIEFYDCFLIASLIPMQVENRAKIRANTPMSLCVQNAFAVCGRKERKKRPKKFGL